MSTENILLIDDNSKNLGQLNLELHKLLKPQGISINAWNPVRNDGNPAQIIKKYLKNKPILVVTDYDLSSDGLTGFYAPTIVRWCKSQLVPVGEYSQQNKFGFINQPNLFDIRVPGNNEDAPAQIASIAEGFISIRNFIQTNKDLLKGKLSLSKLISLLLEREYLDYEFFWYLESIDMVSNNLLLFMNGSKKVSLQKLQVATSYLIGHLLLNSILKFPGPIISEVALCSYLSITTNELDKMAKVFNKAKYNGPFSSIGRFYWREDIDQIVMKNGDDLQDDFEGIGDYNQAVIKNLGINCKPFNCNQCGGKNGGYYCPYTQKTVCELDSCSVASSAWIPRGADVCRIERVFFDNWTPLLNK